MGRSLEIAVDVKNLVKVYPGNVVALRGLSFKVFEGEIYGLIGPNGAGKTTTLRIIATLLKPTSGDVRVFGASILSDPIKIRRQIAYLPEDAGGYKRLTGREFIELMARIRFKESRDREEYVEEAMRIADLKEAIDRRIEGYSKGMKRRLLLATVLAAKPKLAILDEPTSGLDVLQSLKIREVIKNYNKTYGVTVLLSSHNMLEVEFLSHRVGMIFKGAMVAEGPPKELKELSGASNLEEVFRFFIGREVAV